jgi:hypothetical protein
MPEKTLEQIDAELEKEFFSEADDKEKEAVETTTQEEPAEQPVEAVETEDEVELVEVKEEKEESEEKVDKKEYAWKELRNKNQQLQKELEAKQKQMERLEGMAKGLGYTSTNDLLKKYDDEEMTKEAEQKGVDPKFYKEFKQMQSELQSTRKEKEEQYRNLQIQKFTNSLDTLAQENGLTEPEKQEIVNQLESDGYTIDDIVNIKSPKRLLTGYMVDKIAERKVQSKLKQQKKEVFADEKHNSSAEVTEDDLEKRIADEMKQYAKSKGYKL